MTYSIKVIAAWFLSKESMTPKKLQKLCYYTEAWSCALLNRGLVSDSHFEAWAHGPVSPDLYSRYKDYGWESIPKIDTCPIIACDDLDLLESVWATYGDRSANELEALTHTESPWLNARARAGADGIDRCKEVITFTDMATYYKSIYAGD